ncbi:MAG: integrase arm-type DNA-binding domain-containing protein, partial [Gammaproteobacteria bacterium]|nr:integrase arm-type DNA-binding domain-containing protein [Gammaproteobacteria bacterium]
MPKKKRRELKDKLPKRRRLLLRGKAEQESPIPKQASCGTLFSKRVVERLDPPEPGHRDIYRDTRTPHLCLRVTPTAKTFYWEKTVRGSQKRVTIGGFPEINVEQARAKAADIAADYVKEKDV